MTMIKKRISFLLATKNRGKFLKKAFAYIKKIKSRDDELIIIDGLSTDNTKAVIKKYKDWVDIFISEKDQSEAHALNKGILLSQGKYIKFLTDDDIIYKSGLEKAVRIMEENPYVDVLLCGGTRLVEGKRRKFYVNPGTNYGKDVADVFKYGACGIGLVIRKDIFAKVGLLNSKSFALDIDFLTQAISGGANVRFCRIHLFYHPILPHSGTIKSYQKWKADKEKIKKRYGLENIVPGKEVISIIKVLKQKILNKKKQTKYIWDGGFS